MQAKIQSEAQEEMSKSQREYYLREQIRAIRRELGDAEDRSQRADGACAKVVMKKALSDEVQHRGPETAHPPGADAARGGRGHHSAEPILTGFVDLPWKKSSRDRLDIKRAKRILDEDHYGLDKVKDRILEYLAVRKLNP